MVSIYLHKKYFLRTELSVFCPQSAFLGFKLLSIRTKVGGEHPGELTTRLGGKKLDSETRRVVDTYYVLNIHIYKEQTPTPSKFFEFDDLSCETT